LNNIENIKFEKVEFKILLNIKLTKSKTFLSIFKTAKTYVSNIFSPILLMQKNDIFGQLLFNIIHSDIIPDLE